MIEYRKYSRFAIEQIYNTIEDAVASGCVPVDVGTLFTFVKQGDLSYFDFDRNGPIFKLDGIMWVSENGVYECLLQPRSTDIVPGWFVEYVHDCRNDIASKDTSVITIENQFHTDLCDTDKDFY